MHQVSLRLEERVSDRLRITKKQRRFILTFDPLRHARSQLINGHWVAVTFVLDKAMVPRTEYSTVLYLGVSPGEHSWPNV
jgi:hypothetical protein